jgi:acyl-CoA synthetase (AMP-forming)/AMP-acid ligase II
MDDEGRELPPGEVGEICIRSDLVCKGYYRNPEATAQSRRDGWLLTSDCAWRDEEGFVYIVDRKRDMIITGGFNVYSTEIEQVLARHPGVHDCAVIGVPDEKWGEAVKAVVVRADGAVAEAELIALCRAELGSVKTPKSIEFRDELPKSPNGKVLKRALRDEFWKGHERALTA